MNQHNPWPDTADIAYRSDIGPALRGTRLAMTDIAQILQVMTPEQAADVYNLPVEKIYTSIEYIKANQQRVDADLKAIREREARGNPPELEAKLHGSRERLMARKHEIEERNARKLAPGETSDARAAG
jgi:hypothetical protein